MQVTIIHNPTAGDASLTRDELLRAVRAAGHAVVYQSTKSADYPSAVQEPGDVVLVAGGDGTLRRVALELHGSSTPIALLPLGTANNVATTLGIAGDLDSCVRRLSAGVRTPFDLGRCRGTRGERAFVEGAGLGLVPELIRVMDKYDGGAVPGANRLDELRRARRVLQRMVSLLPAFDCSIDVAGESLQVRVLLLQLMNVRSVGPRVPVAPAADPSDGKLDLVWVEESCRDELGAAVQCWIEGQAVRLEGGHRRAAEVTVRWTAARMHVDDELRRMRKHKENEVSFSCEKGRVTLLL